jgi:uncharacterized cupin superfamily protein
MTHVGHWDDAPTRRRDVGHIRSTWYDLGAAAGSRTIGAHRIDVDAGGFSTPVHAHGVEEEAFWVRAGSGLLWQDGATCAVGEGDTIVHRPAAEAHTLRAGGDGLSVIAFGQRHDGALCHLPRAGVSWAPPSWVDAGGPHPFEREAAVGPPDCPPPTPDRPANVVALAAAPTGFGGVARLVGAAGGAEAAGLNHVSLPPGGAGAPAHVHSAEEELFVLLSGSATLRLGDDEIALRPGSVVARPAGTAVAHSLVAGGDGVTYLVYGTREPNDVTFYPDTRTVRLRGLGVSFEV